MRAAFLLLAVAAACAGHACSKELRRAADLSVPPSDRDYRSLAPAASREEILDAIDEGLRTQGKGPDFTRFVVLRAADRHLSEIRDESFHVVIGADVRMPAGTMRIRRRWLTSGEIDGVNEEPQRLGVSVAVEREAAQPFPEATVASARAFCAALLERVPIHPDCILAMGEIPYTRPSGTDGEERRLAAAVRDGLPPPPVDGTLEIVSGERRVAVTYERRDTTNAIEVGMMFRKRFDGENRGMLFVYPHRYYRKYWMRNVFIPIDLAYIRAGRIDQLVKMKPEAGTPGSEIPRYESRSAVRYVLEMPEGWFERNGISEGALVEGLE